MGDSEMLPPDHQSFGAESGVSVEMVLRRQNSTTLSRPQGGLLAVLIVHLDLAAGPSVLTMFPRSIDMSTATSLREELLHNTMIPQSCNAQECDDVLFTAAATESLCEGTGFSFDAHSSVASSPVSPSPPRNDTHHTRRTSSGADLAIRGPMIYFTGAIAVEKGTHVERGARTRGVILLTTICLPWNDFKHVLRTAADSLSQCKIDPLTLAEELYHVAERGGTISALPGAGPLPMIPPGISDTPLESLALNGSVDEMMQRFGEQMLIVRRALLRGYSVAVYSRSCKDGARCVASLVAMALTLVEPGLPIHEVCLFTDSPKTLDALCKKSGFWIASTTNTFVVERWTHGDVMIDLSSNEINVRPALKDKIRLTEQDHLSYELHLKAAKGSEGRLRAKLSELSKLKQDLNATHSVAAGVDIPPYSPTTGSGVAAIATGAVGEAPEHAEDLWRTRKRIAWIAVLFVVMLIFLAVLVT